MRNRRDEFALGDIGGNRFNAAKLCPQAVAKGSEIGHVFLRVEESIGMNRPGEQARAVPVVCGVKDREEGDRASVADDFPQQSRMSTVSGVATQQLRASFQSGST